MDAHVDTGERFRGREIALSIAYLHFVAHLLSGSPRVMRRYRGEDGDFVSAGTAGHQGGPVEFQLLGPVRALAGGRPLDLGVRKQRFVLAVLLLEANKMVPAERLVDLIWPDGAPRSARGVIHTQISRMRSMLTAADAARHGVVLFSDGPGYLLRCAPERIDVHRFRRLCAEARDGVDDETRIRLLNEALALWQGPALATIAPEEIRARLAGHLEEARLVALEERFDAYLSLGRHVEVIHELTELVGDQPYRQQLVARLMLALHRGDRTPEALTTFQELRRRLDSELGIEPAATLRQLQVQILRDDPALRLPPAVSAAGSRPPGRGDPRPRQLPPGVDHYVGRERHLDVIRSLLAPPPDHERFAVPVVTVTGKPGLGKTALAVRAAHRLAPRFPDGQLFVDLRGNGPEPRDPGEVLVRFLRDLGVPGEDVPLSLEERTSLFRDRTATRRLLVVLDNAASEEQVRPLVPGNPECAVLVTSRRRLAGLDVRSLVDLDGLGPDDALLLLRELVGDGITAEDDAARRIVELCGGLPLALRIVGTKLGSRPHLTVAALAERLEDERDRLDELVSGDREVRASFLLSYDTLTRPLRRAFRLLALTPSTGVPSWAAAAVLDEGPRATRRLLDHLVEANLLESCGPQHFGDVRYRFHDLLRLYAQEKLAAHVPKPEQEAARSRLADLYLNLGKRADAKLEFGGLHHFEPPPLVVDAPDLAEKVERDALGWLTDEYPAIIQAIEHAAATRQDEKTCQLSATLAAFLELRAQWIDLRHVAELSLAAADRMASPYWTAYALFALGLAARETRDFGRAEQSFRAGLEVLPAADDPLMEVVTLLSVAVGHRLQGRWAEAADLFAGCLSRLDLLGEPRWRAYTLRESGILYRYQGNWSQAEDCLRQAATTFGRLGDIRWEAASLRELGIVLRETGDHVTAVDLLTRSRDALHEVGDLRRTGAAWRALAYTHRKLGALDEALGCALRSREVLALTLDKHGFACTEIFLGDVYTDLGEMPAAREHLDNGVTAFGSLGDVRWQGKSLISLGRHLSACGDQPAAEVAWRAALEQLTRLGAHEAHEVRDLLAHRP